MNFNEIEDFSKVTKEIRSLVPQLAKTYYKKNPSFGFGAAMRDAWFVINTAIAILNEPKTSISGFAFAVQKAKFALIVKKGIKAAEVSGDWFSFTYMTKNFTNERPAEGRSVTSRNYEFKGSGKKKARHTLTYFDRTRNAIRSVRIESLLIGSHIGNFSEAVAA